MQELCPREASSGRTRPGSRESRLRNPCRPVLGPYGHTPEQILNLIENNVFVKCGAALDVVQQLTSVNYKQPPYSTAYPDLAAVPDNWAQLKVSTNARGTPHGE